MFLVVYFSNLHLKLPQYSLKLCSASGQAFISFSHLHKRFGAKRSSALRIRDLKVMLHEGIRRHVGYVLMTHTFPLEGGRDPSLCSQRERTSNHAGHLCC